MLNWERLRVTVTGGAGFLGSHLCKRLLDEGSFDAPDLGSSRTVIDENFVRERLEGLVEDEDHARFIL